MKYFQTKNPNWGICILKGLAMENVSGFHVRCGKSYCHLVYFKTISHIMWSFGDFSRFGNPGSSCI
jgi:hypothetical protein